jgi:hypothetical protein
MREARKNAEDLDNIISDLGKTSKTFSERLDDVNKRLKSTFKDAISSADKAVKSFTDAIARAIVTGQSMGEVFKNVGIQILTFFISAILEAVIMALFLRDILDAIEERLGKQESASDKASKSLRMLAASTALAGASQALFGQQTAFANNQLIRQQELEKKQQKSTIGSAIGGALFGGVGAAVGGIIGGFFADGGRPPIGRPSVVGEKGAEVFVPDSAGTIIPNNQLGGVTNVTFNINTVDQRGFAELLDGRRGQIINMVNTALNNKGRTALV